MLLRLVRSHDVLLESFRPGVMERLGVGYERLREENPGLVYCAITGYGQDGPYTARSGHDMNYLGLNGLLGLTGDAGGPPVQAAGQIADVGGGALTAAFGILAALRERERSGEGQLVDVSMFDGSLAWLALVAARYLADGQAPARGRPRAGRQPDLLPAVRLQGRLGHARRARAEVLAGVVPRRRPRGPDREAVLGARLRGARRGGAGLPHAHARRVDRVRLSARLLPGAGAGPRRGARLGAGARARDGGADRPARDRRGRPAGRAGEAVAHAGHAGRARAGARRAHARGAGGGGATPTTEIAALLESGAAAEAASEARGSFLS